MQILNTWQPPTSLPPFWCIAILTVISIAITIIYFVEKYLIKKTGKTKSEETQSSAFSIGIGLLLLFGLFGIPAQINDIQTGKTESLQQWVQTTYDTTITKQTTINLKEGKLVTIKIDDKNETVELVPTENGYTLTKPQEITPPK